jgi:hypothetical protein
MPRFFGFFIKNRVDLDSRLGDCRDTCHQRLIFQIFLEDKGRRLKTKLTLSLILQVNLRVGGYSLWSASSIAPHIKEDFTTTRGISTSQPRCSQGSTRKTPSTWSLRELKNTFRSTRKPAVLDYEELEGLSDPGPWDCVHVKLHGP